MSKAQHHIWPRSSLRKSGEGGEEAGFFGQGEEEEGEEVTKDNKPKNKEGQFPQEIILKKVNP